MKISFSPRQKYQKFFLFCTLTTKVTVHADFGLIWTTPWPDEKDVFLNFANREICKVPYENLTFFLGKLYRKTLWVLNSDYNGDIPYPLWFDLNNSLTWW